MENSRYKFRAWDKTHNKMLKDLLIADKCVIQRYHDINGQICFRTLETYHDARMDYKPMQYTGLKDKNGVEIYELDIVKDLRSPFKDARSYSKVFYQEDRGRFVFGGWEIPAGMSHTFEVIGNIYEHSNLLDNN